MVVRTRHRRRALALAAILAVLGAGCSGEPTATHDWRALDDGDVVASTGTGPVVLEITGSTAGTVSFGLPELEAARTVELETYEPFVKRDVTFTGVLLADVLAAAPAPDGATSLRMVALNDYVVDVPLDVLRHPDVVLATLADGDPIALEDGGPLRIVLGRDHPDVANEALWIWSLATADYR